MNERGESIVSDATAYADGNQFCHDQTYQQVADKACTPEQRHFLIAEAAYLRAAQRGFQSGDSVTDWLEAEAEIDAMLCGNTMTNITTQVDFQAQLEAQLKKWDKKLSALTNKAKKAQIELHQDVQAQLAAFHTQREMARDKLKSLRQHSEGAWEDMKKGAENTWDEMQKTVDNIVTHFKK